MNIGILWSLVKNFLFFQKELEQIEAASVQQYFPWFSTFWEKKEGTVEGVIENCFPVVTFGKI